LQNESHGKERIGWLRAAVLGANDGLISTSSLVVGVATAGPSHSAIMLTAIAGLAAGTLSMASGEYVSVSSQADTEQADLTQERGELAASPKAEHAELASLYVARGLTRKLAIPPPRYSHGHPIGDNPLRGANEEEGRNPAGWGIGGRP
jgi:VIT1/CCC1 family predicted Fe2+/Mn2+ transporter